MNLSLSGKPFDAAIDHKVRGLCPTLYAYYRSHSRLRSPRLQERSNAVGG